MPSNSIEISNYEAWGKLVKSWSTGKNYFGGPAEIQIPHTLDELKQQCADVGVAVTLDPAVTGLAIVRYSEEVLTVKLPPKSMVEKTESDLAAGAYALPDFYDDTYKAHAGATQNLAILTEQGRLKFHAERIGDYSIQNCG